MATGDLEYLDKAGLNELWAKIKNTFAAKATTLAGYGITDANINGETITLGSNTITGITTGSQTFSGAKTFSAVTTVKTLTISSTSAEQHIKFSRSNYNYITVPSGSALHVNIAGAADTSNSYRFDSSSFRPHTNAAFSLGTTSVLWNGIFGKALSIGSSSSPLATTANVPIQIWKDLGNSKTQDVTMGFLESNVTSGTKTFCIYSWQATNGTPVGIGYLPMCFGASDSTTNNAIYFTGTAAYSGATNSNYWGIHTNNPSYLLHVNGTFGANTIYENGTAISSLYTYTAGSSIDITNNVVSAKEASTIQSGVVTTAAQSFAGLKTFTNGLTSNTTITVNDTTASTAAIALTGAANKYITVPTSQTLTLSMNGAANNNLGFVFSGTYLRPTVTETMFLGGADNRWQGIYGVGLSLTGACAVGTDLTVGGTTTVSGNITPSSNSTSTSTGYNLGASSYRFRYVYGRYLNISSTSTLSGTVTCSSTVRMANNTSFQMRTTETDTPYRTVLTMTTGNEFQVGYSGLNMRVTAARTDFDNPIILANNKSIGWMMYGGTTTLANMISLNTGDVLAIGYAHRDTGETRLHGQSITQYVGTTKIAEVNAIGVTSYGGVAAMGIADLSIN